MIEFNVPLEIGSEIDYVIDAVQNRKKISGDGYYTKLSSTWFEETLNTKKALLTTSCTHAIEMAALLLEFNNEDEIIAPSYTFVSTINPFILRGSKVVFVDIKKETMNIDESLIEAAITPKTKAIMVVHYAGVACEMDKIMEIAKKHKLYVIEDAAQAIMSTYKGKYLGTIGDIGTFSFHETKNITCGEGGVLLLNDEQFIERAEIIREKGTNRSKFFRGQIDKYTWVDQGSSYLPSELNAAYLYAQLQNIDLVINKRRLLWDKYYELFLNQTFVELPSITLDSEHNGHIFYIKCKDIDERTELSEYLKTKAINTYFHYIPLHSAPAGMKFTRFYGFDKFTTQESERLLRLPMHYDLSMIDVTKVYEEVIQFYFGKKHVSI